MLVLGRIVRNWFLVGAVLLVTPIAAMDGGQATAPTSQPRQFVRTLPPILWGSLCDIQPQAAITTRGVLLRDAAGEDTWVIRDLRPEDMGVNLNIVGMSPDTLYFTIYHKSTFTFHLMALRKAVPGAKEMAKIPSRICAVDAEGRIIAAYENELRTSTDGKTWSQPWFPFREKGSIRSMHLAGSSRLVLGGDQGQAVQVVLAKDSQMKAEWETKIGSQPVVGLASGAKDAVWAMTSEEVAEVSSEGQILRKVKPKGEILCFGVGKDRLVTGDEKSLELWDTSKSPPETVGRVADASPAIVLGAEGSRVTFAWPNKIFVVSDAEVGGKRASHDTRFDVSYGMQLIQAWEEKQGNATPQQIRDFFELRNKVTEKDWERVTADMTHRIKDGEKPTKAAARAIETLKGIAAKTDPKDLPDNPSYQEMANWSAAKGRVSNAVADQIRAEAEKKNLSPRQRILWETEQFKKSSTTQGAGK